MRGCSLQDPSVRLEERPGGLRTPNTWLSGLGAGQASPTSRTPGCSHIMLGLPALGAQAAGLCVGQTQRSCGASAPDSILGTPLRTHGAWAALGMTHARSPLGDTWHLGHTAGPKGDGFGVRTHNEWVQHQDPIIIGSFFKTQGFWVLGF